jgi:hypothetical protein
VRGLELGGCTVPEPPLIPLQAQPGSCHMHRPQEEKHLAQADGHIAELKAQIDHQRKNLKRIAERGEPSATAESFLHALEQSLRIFEKHREMVIQQLREQSEWDLTTLVTTLGKKIGT